MKNYKFIYHKVVEVVSKHRYYNPQTKKEQWTKPGEEVPEGCPILETVEVSRSQKTYRMLREDFIKNAELVGVLGKRDPEGRTASIADGAVST